MDAPQLMPPGVEQKDIEDYPLLRPDRVPYLPTAFLLQAQLDIAPFLEGDDQVSHSGEGGVGPGRGVRP